MGFGQLWRNFDNLFLPVAKRAYLGKLSRIEKRLDGLSNRMGLLQLGESAPLFASVPGLSDMATGGVGARRALVSMRQALEGASLVRWSNVDGTIAEIETFITDANLVLDEYDRDRPKKDQMFAARSDLKGLF